MHDIASIFPQLKSKTLTAESAKILDSYTIESPWRRCWEFVLTHEMTDTERSAFWHGAYISLQGGVMRSKTKKIDDNWIVNQLRQERYERGISLSELAKNIGVSKSSISDWENHRKIPTLDNVIVWAVGLGFHLDLSKRSLKDS